MKNIFRYVLPALTLAIVFASCKKDEKRVVFEGGTAPVLTASAAGPFVLLQPERDKPAVTLKWTNPDYKFNTGVSSQDVTYTLQIDTAGSNFTLNPNKQEVAIANDLSVSYKNGSYRRSAL
jgi:hypothetical protein